MTNTVYGELDEVCFIYADNRAHRHVQSIVSEQFNGTIVSDGYAAYSRFAQHNDAVTHAQCWTHTRRQFVEAEKDEPEAVAHVLDLIGYLYRHESDIKDKTLSGEAKHVYRTTRSKPIVDYIFAWVNEQRQREDILPKR